MARTPLFTVLRRSLRLAQHANVSGEPADSATDRWRDSMRMSRRTFVAGGTVVAAGLATGCAPASRRPSSATGGARADDEPIVIVGAGIAGLTCAYRLRAAGLPVRVMEAQSRTGGRMYSLRNHFADGQVCELGGELIDTGHSHIRALAGELNIGLNDLATDDPTLDDTVWFVDGVRRTEADVVREFQPLARRIEAALAPLGSSPDPTAANPQGAVALDRMTLTQWFDQEGVSGWLRKLLDVAYTTSSSLRSHPDTP